MSVRRSLVRLVPAAVRRVLAPTGYDRGQLWRRAGFKWCLDRLTVSADSVEADAWVVSPFPEQLALCWNGRPLTTLSVYDRPDLLATYPFLREMPEWKALGIIAAGQLPAEQTAPGTWAEIRFADASGPRQDLGPPFWHRIPRPDDPPLPDARRRARVHGEEAEATYLRAGQIAFGQLRAALQQTTGRDFSDFPQILDWGCGSGRVARYFRDLPEVSLTGVDVDPDNVGWCQQHLPHATFHTIPLHPPTPLPHHHFDLAIGVSVFTHLKEPEQFEWLAELQRLVRPGGILLMTFHGEAAVLSSHMPPGDYRKLLRRGFLDTPDRRYDAALPEADYYRTTCHTEDYIRREWGKYFDILAILPGHLFVQDLAVLRRR